MSIFKIYYNMEDEIRRLYRDTNDRKLAGVCSGIAHFFKVDTTIIRILFLIALLCGSIGFWIYLIVWICAPEKAL